MIKIDVQEPTDKGWRKWRRNCATATKAVIKSHENGSAIGITKLYARQRPFYKSRNGPFRGKCSYCETRFIESQPGDVDHFRPKDRIEEDINGRRVILTVKNAGGQVPHPGYYWLAYEWRNLLPTCADCNRPNRGNTKSGLCVGKWCLFPVDGFRALKPGEEIDEDSLLINPVDVDPADHLLIDRTGIMSAKDGSKKGDACLKVFGLNEREALVKARREAYSRAEDALLRWINALYEGNDAVAQEKYIEIEEWRNGSAPYSAAGRTALRARQPALQQIGQLM